MEVSKPILQSTLMDPPWDLPNGTRLPGTGPIAAADWIRRDDAFAGQMELRDRLIEEITDKVHVLRPAAIPAARELLQMTLSALRADVGYSVDSTTVTRPDGIRVDIDFDAPLLTLGRLVQEDLCLLQQSGSEHVMTGAVLCFPASWSLDEKIDRSLIGIHEPVGEYTSDIARRVQRLFNAIRPGKPMVRANCLLYSDAHLFQPRRMEQRRERPGAVAKYVRTERQCFIRLPDTDAVAFSIHTTVVLRASLSALDQAALSAYLEGHASV